LAISGVNSTTWALSWRSSSVVGVDILLRALDERAFFVFESSGAAESREVGGNGWTVLVVAFWRWWGSCLMRKQRVEAETSRGLGEVSG
jgi:hypothetical protein